MSRPPVAALSSTFEAMCFGGASPAEQFRSLTCAQQ